MPTDSTDLPRPQQLAHINSSRLQADGAFNISSPKNIPKAPSHMKAIIYRHYGGPEQLLLADVPTPSVGADELRVRVHAASVNALDWRGLRADPFFIRFMGHGIFRPKHPILGADIAGVVEAVGANVSDFRVGDAVFGDASFGGFAEYVSVRADRVAPLPEGITFAQAAALPVAATTALQGLRVAGPLDEGKRVLINGASGGVGAYAVQLARLFGAEVTAVCRTEKADFVRAQGAHHVIDYTREDFADRLHAWDLVFDLALMRSVAKARRAVRPGGTYAMAGGAGAEFLRTMFLKPWLRNTNITLVMAETNTDDLRTLADLVAAGQLTPPVDCTFSLEEVPDAIRYLEERRVRGKVVIQIA